jgi:hypothetical protein
MSRKLKVVLFALLVMAMPAFLMGTMVPQNQPGPTNPGNGSCSYCSSGNCGCEPPALGCVLNFSCGCSSTDCNHTCIYNCH